MAEEKAPPPAAATPGGEAKAKDAPAKVEGKDASGHPDLRRILTWEGFNGYPLRKDFPLEGIDTGAAVYPEEWPEGAGPGPNDPNRKVVS